MSRVQEKHEKSLVLKLLFSFQDIAQRQNSFQHCMCNIPFDHIPYNIHIFLCYPSYNFLLTYFSSDILYLYSLDTTISFLINVIISITII